MAWNYSNTAVETTLTANVSSGATTITVGVTTGFPLTTPYSLTLDYGQPTAEVVTVTAVAGTSLTVTRGADSTLAQSHNAGARVVHTIVARDVREPQQHMDATADVHGVGASNNVLGTGTTQTLTNKSISGTNNTLTNLPAAQVTGTFTSVSSSGPISSTGAISAGAGVSGTTGTFTGAVSVDSLASTGTVTAGSLSTTGATSTGSLATTGNATVGGTTTLTGAVTAAGQVEVDDDLLTNNAKYMATPDTAASAKSYGRGFISPETTSTPSVLGITAASTGAAPTVASTSFTFPVAGRYTVKTGVPIWGDAGVEYRFDLYIDGNLVDYDDGTCRAGAFVSIKKNFDLYSTAAGAKTIAVKVFRISASGALNCSAGTAYIRVYHEGD